MGIEQYGLGSLEVFRVFYEIKAGRPRRNLFIQGNTGGAYERPGCLQAGFRRFITMKLNQGRWYVGAGSYYFCSGHVDKKQNRSDKRRQAASQFGGAFRADMARAGFVHDKTDGIDTSRNRCIHVFLAREAADLDAGADRGILRFHAGVSTARSDTCCL